MEPLFFMTKPVRALGSDWENPVLWTWCHLLTTPHSGLSPRRPTPGPQATGWSSRGSLWAPPLWQRRALKVKHWNCSVHMGWRSPEKGDTNGFHMFLWTLPLPLRLQVSIPFLEVKEQMGCKHGSDSNRSYRTGVPQFLFCNMARSSATCQPLHCQAANSGWGCSVGAVHAVLATINCC